MHLYFAIHEGQAENHLLCFPYDLNTHLTFIVSLFMIFRLCFFSCYNMVAKFLLSWFRQQICHRGRGMAVCGRG
jgi:hypothetical protein